MTPIEVRKKLVDAHKRGLSVKEIQRAYNYGKSTIYDILELERETGSVKPRAGPCGRKLKLAPDEYPKVTAAIDERPDITLEDLKESLNLPVSVSRLSRIVRGKLGYTYKKRWCMPPRENSQM